jgi:septal ring factor EnvC (AmiA/AmiB activator)
MDALQGYVKVKRKRDDVSFRYVNTGTKGCLEALMEELKDKLEEKRKIKAEDQEEETMVFEGRPEDSKCEEARPKREEVPRQKRKYVRIKDTNSRYGFFFILQLMFI